MKKILLFGAGKSATYLIEYLGALCDENDWRFIVCDVNVEVASAKIKIYKNANALPVDVSNDGERKSVIEDADIVISMLPPHLHFLVAKDCIVYKKNLLTASYIDSEIEKLKDEIADKNLLFLYEMGLDPGIDHMSAMRMIDSIKNDGGEIKSFISHCGGLIAPKSDNNPWHYKFTWNPQNVVLAGKKGASYLELGKSISLNYDEVFSKNNPPVKLPGLPELAFYANRDSFDYIPKYGLQGVDTFIRTTLRYPDFILGWEKLIRMDLVNINDGHEIRSCKSFADWYILKKEQFLMAQNANFEYDLFFDKEFKEQLAYLDIDNSTSIPFKDFTSAKLLQYLLEKSLKLDPADHDMIVMLHEIEFTKNGKTQWHRSYMVLEGEDPIHTAMAKTVGLPLGIAAKLILLDKINLKGLHIPIVKEIYAPVLEELKKHNIYFIDQA
ncbi:MAG: saccharopine dehydrogenase C-terminal domain-containing protein [Ferruginibacter sp.]